MPEVALIPYTLFMPRSGFYKLGQMFGIRMRKAKWTIPPQPRRRFGDLRRDARARAIAGLYDQVWEERRVLPLDQIPRPVVQAVLAAEDSRFFEHGAIDVRGIAARRGRNVARGRVVEGGSTLTQQLMKNFFLTEERTFRRKARELAMAIVAERRYSKNQILEHYLNEIYLGSERRQGHLRRRRGGAVLLRQESSPTSRSARRALLAGLIRAPNANSPFRSPSARWRGATPCSARWPTTARSTPRRPRRRAPSRWRCGRTSPTAPTRRTSSTSSAASCRPLSARGANAEGLRIFTSLDGEMQAAAEGAVRDGLATLERRLPEPRRDEPEEQLEARADRDPSRDRRDQGHGRRPRLPHHAVQPHHRCAAPAGLGVQAGRVLRRVRSRRRRAAVHAGDPGRGRAVRVDLRAGETWTPGNYRRLAIAAR